MPSTTYVTLPANAGFFLCVVHSTSMFEYTEEHTPWFIRERGRTDDGSYWVELSRFVSDDGDIYPEDIIVFLPR